MKTNFKLLAGLTLGLTLAACGNRNSQNDLLSAQNQNNGIYNGVSGGCMPLTTQLSFSAQGASINDIFSIAGNMPANSNRPGTYGQVVMGAGYMQQTGVYPYGSGAITMSKSGAQGGISMNIIAPTYQYGNTNYPGAPATITGMVQLSQQVLSALQAQSGYMSMPYNTGYQTYPYGQINPYQGYGTSPYGMANCISSIAFQSIHQVQPGYNGMPGSGYIQQVLMYLYMNNGSAPTPIIF